MAKVGMRNFKTAIAVAMCLIVLKFVGVENPFFACITAIYTMQTDFSTSLKMGSYRLFGTIFGSIIGSIFAVIAYKYLPMDIVFIEALVIPIGIMLIIHILTMLKLKDTVLISCVVFLAIMINVEGNVMPKSYAIDRTLSTIFGAAVALLVNRFIYPYKVNENSVETE